jgi:N-acylneuraminate cytidylyltransferase
MYLGITPARSGSKRIKNKNIKYFFVHLIIRYSIYQARLSKFFKEIIVSTDSVRIKKIALGYGANLPFLRSKKLADDYTPLNKVSKNLIKK